MPGNASSAGYIPCRENPGCVPYSPAASTFLGYRESAHASPGPVPDGEAESDPAAREIVTDFGGFNHLIHEHLPAVGPPDGAFAGVRDRPRRHIQASLAESPPGTPHMVIAGEQDFPPGGAHQEFARAQRVFPRAGGRFLQPDAAC